MRRLKKIAAIAVLAALCLAALGCSAADKPAAFKYYSYRSKAVFGESITMQAAVRGGSEKAALDEMYEFVAAVDAEMSLSHPQSALSRFNAAKEYERVEVSERVYNVVCASREYYCETDGAFDITVYPLVKLWRVDSEGLGKYAYASADEVPPPPDIDAVRETASYCGMDKLFTEETDGKYYLYKSDSRLEIDLGAVAKGYAAEECARIAAKHGVRSAYIDVSGNVRLVGEWYHNIRRNYERWVVGVTSPRPRGGLSGVTCALSVSGDKTLVTAGDYVRYYKAAAGGEPLYVPHIVSTRTGLPLGVEYDGEYRNASDNIISATVICDDSARADAYATGVCVMGKEKAVEFLRSRGVSAVIVTADGKMLLVGVNESGAYGDAYFTAKDEYGAYSRYSIEEYPFE